MIRGLVLGKFMPFHTGHIALIDFAIANTALLDILVCANTEEPVNAVVRYNWVKDYYRYNNKVQVHLIAYDAAVMSASSAASKEAALVWAQYLKEKFPAVNLFVSSEPYGEYVAAYMGIVHLCFDEKRKLVPVSATAIREQPFKNWLYLPAIVRPYFIKKICIAGSESTGKSTLTKKLADYYATLYVPEVARDIVDSTESCTVADLHHIVNAHAKAITASIPLANKLLFVDTDITITRSYASFLFGTTIEAEDWVYEANRFDLYLFLETDCEFVQDGTRLDVKERERLNSFHKKEFIKQQIAVNTIRGNWEERFRAAINMIDQNFFERTA